MILEIQYVYGVFLHWRMLIALEILTGDTGIALCYRYMYAISRMNTKSIGGYSFVWEVTYLIKHSLWLIKSLLTLCNQQFCCWQVCAYKVLGINAYKQEQDEADTYSRMWRWRSENRKGRTMASTFSNYREALDRIGDDQVRTIP